MPWKETGAMQERMKLISDYLTDQYTITDLADIYQISRKTVYKWISRYEDEGFDGLKERSRCPHHIPHRTEESHITRLAEIKESFPSWGPRKVVRYLERTEPDISWPSPSTAGYWFNKLGLVVQRKPRRRTPPYTEPFKDCDAPNAVWSADFKGHFRMGNGRKCYPLTISDNYSRYLLLCRGLEHPDFVSCHRWFSWAFNAYGLPAAIRTDNGVPFAGRSKGGLSRLSVWWIQLGIVPERIKAGHPQQNGRHERMHRTLKAEATKPASADLQRQQARFNSFVQQYNEIRPHEALTDQPPGDVYVASSRRMPKKIREYDYDSDCVIRSVRTNGEFRWDGELYYLSELLTGLRIGLKPIDDGLYAIMYRFHPLGILDCRAKKVITKL